MKLNLTLLTFFALSTTATTIDLSGNTFCPTPYVDMYGDKIPLPTPSPLIMFNDDNRVSLNFIINESGRMEVSHNDRAGTYSFAQTSEKLFMLIVTLENNTQLVLKLDTTEDDEFLLEEPLTGTEFSSHH